MICADGSEQDHELAEITGCSSNPSATQPWRCGKRVQEAKGTQTLNLPLTASSPWEAQKWYEE